MLAVETDGLCKRYGRFDALRDVCLHVPAGTLFGFMGPNGAGKTTTIRILLGLLRASSGGARALGRDVWREGPELRREVGYLPGDVRLYDHLTGRATLAFFDRVRGEDSSAEIDRLGKRLDLDLDRRVRNYSRGMKQKLGLMQALMHRPALLVLDEPTIALDPLVRQALFEELRRAAGEGRTVLFSSHTLGEVEELCERVAILRGGRLIEQDTIDGLRRRAVRRVEVRFEAQCPMPQPFPPGLTVSGLADGRVVATWAGPMGELLHWLARGAVRDVIISPPDLEDLFLAYYSNAAEAAR